MSGEPSRTANLASASSGSAQGTGEQRPFPSTVLGVSSAGIRSAFALRLDHQHAQQQLTEQEAQRRFVNKREGDRVAKIRAKHLRKALRAHEFVRDVFARTGRYPTYEETDARYRANSPHVKKSAAAPRLSDAEVTTALVSFRAACGVPAPLPHLAGSDRGQYPNEEDEQEEDEEDYRRDPQLRPLRQEFGAQFPFGSVPPAAAAAASSSSAYAPGWRPLSDSQVERKYIDSPVAPDSQRDQGAASQSSDVAPPRFPTPETGLLLSPLEAAAGPGSPEFSLDSSPAPRHSPILGHRRPILSLRFHPDAVPRYSFFVPTGAENREQTLVPLSYQLDFFPVPLSGPASAQRVSAPVPLPPLGKALAFAFRSPPDSFRDAVVRSRTDTDVPPSLVHAFDAVDCEGYPVRVFRRAHDPLLLPAQYSPEF